MSPAGPYPTKAQFQALDARTKVTLLDAGPPVSVQPAPNQPVATQSVGTVVLRGGGTDTWVQQIGLDLPLGPEDVLDLSAFTAPDGTGGPTASGVIQGVTRAGLPNLPDWSLIRLSNLLRLPAGGSLRLTLAQGVPAQVRATPSDSSTPGATVTLLDAQGAQLVGLVYVTAYPPAQEQAGRLSRSGMRVVQAPSATFEPGDAEIVDTGVAPPALRYRALNGVEYTLPFSAS